MPGHAVDSLFATSSYLLTDRLGSLGGHAVVLLVTRLVRRFAMVAQLTIIAYPTVRPLRLLIGV